MPPPAVLLPRLTALSLLSVLLPVRVPPVAQGVQAHSAPGGKSTAYLPRASIPPRAGSGHARRRPGLHLSMMAVDHADRRLQYRVVGGLVQRSTDGGRQWATILTPGGSRRLRVGGCHPARYRRVNALVVSGLLPGTLFVAAGGDPGHVPRTRHAGACTAATGGLFVLRPDGHGDLRRTDSLAAGLPYAQNAPGRTPRAYALRALVTDPTNPAMLYADAAIAPSTSAQPASPPAGLYRSSDGGHYWSPAVVGLPRPGRGAPRSTLTLDPAHGAIAFDVIGPTLYRSVNHGGAWSAVRGLRARHTLCLFLNPANPQLVYALSDQGLYHSRDAGATWTPLTGRRLPAVGRIRTLTFDVHAPASVSVVPWQGPPLRLVERHAPLPPRFDVALALVPQRYDRVVLAVHAAPLARAHLTVVGGANRTSARLATDAAGFGYASVRLRGHVVAATLRVRVQLGRRTLVLKPWLPPGWVPGWPPRPTATPIPTATATSTPMATPTLTPTATLAIPTPYPASSLGDIWAWKALTPVLPPCPVPATATATASATITSTAPATQTLTPAASASAVSALTPASTTPASATPSETPTPTSTPVPTQTPSPAATATAVGPCDAGPPAPRQDYAAAWDNADHRLYVFGGTNSRMSVAYNDISAYSTITGAWTTIAPVTPPPPGRYGAASVWDSSLGVLLIFGGMTGAGPSARFTNDVWAYAPATNVWTPLSANGAPGAPSPRAHAAAAWDPATNRLLIFGGQTSDTAMPTLANDLWSFTLNGLSGAWTQLAPNGASPNLPPPRQWAQMAWDVPAGVLRLFGGKNAGGGALSDTWTWAPLSGWQYENVPDQPPGRLAAGYYWDDTHAHFVVGPGLSMLGNSDDVWAYDPSGNDWLQVPTEAAPTPPLRQMAHMVWDAADNQALLFGGRQQGTGASNDLWALVPTGLPAGPVPAPPSSTPLLKAVDIGQTVNRANNDVLLTPATVQRVATSGASVARVSFYIGDGATSWTPARLHAYEQVITMLAQQGIGLLAVAGSGITGGWSPANWTQNAQETTGGNGDNPAIQDYARQLSLLVSHFHDAPYNVRQWEVWNEPDVPLAGCFTFALSCLQQPSLQPSNFAALLAETYTAVKGNPATRDVQLISGGIFGHSINGTYSAGAAGGDYLRHTYDEGINHGTWTAVKAQTGSYPLDAVGEHLYVDQSQRTTPAVIHTYLDWFHNAYAAYEGAAKGTAITEAGWRTGDPNEPQVIPDIQALNLDNTFEAARRAGYVQDLCWFQLQDAPGYLHNTSWGLLDRTGQPKLAYLHFQAQ